METRRDGNDSIGLQLGRFRMYWFNPEIKTETRLKPTQVLILTNPTRVQLELLSNLDMIRIVSDRFREFTALHILTYV